MPHNHGILLNSQSRTTGTLLAPLAHHPFPWHHFRSPTIPSPRHRFRSPPSPSHRSARCHRFHSPGTAILDFGGDFRMILGIFGGNFGFRWQFWEVSAIFRWQFWENCLFLQCNNERHSLRGDNKAKGYHCAKIIK